ncbi:hypothetical protein EV198_2801 [Roseivirga ehrenbergii]|uniref:Uncharacterized protein n=1 Tax=Roseivirga ehrenbergii (strain DSM 102268 / JCM 13514 / KCTC 12282 / NCIMB 14502 / KMM 6017) TaxID=279360 RepID=A0A150XTX1_ROSEK|nr:hypothetical protein [Roseivirga ehrenbergii]KYG82181.1 hypothetical protein MB14_01940 [Roseivirga ehrenbergii]TCL02009.1 hypothetical protein EV198_2801 [Roseivirga ehrenbergii]
MKSRKQELEQSNASYKELLEDQFDLIKNNFQDTGKKALWIGGALVLAYGLTKLITSSASEEDEETEEGQVIEIIPEPSVSKKVKLKKIVHHEPKEESAVVSALKHQAIVFVLGLAAKKLGSFLNELGEKEENSGS